ncbi:tetratricopeptide repeat protein [Marinobacter sp. X15-166B]|uniref:tetratricopeptide repeat protein n=1 Tax=Marinobacter sp. X15-166B TaxID=1897620 RepID=UPI00085C4040|nr:tetratricopeptide repeat protein [Marinobacter sp. X15-166B]OEY67740.1 hypothetical protein BG841_15760 [Marinobacter sp. X15-166B]
MKTRKAFTKRFPLARASLLSIAITMATVGCGEESTQNQEDVQYLSHLDQSRFFQRQGELRASTVEARSAIELQAGEPAPYFILVENLITAGDGINAEHQLDELATLLESADPSRDSLNRIVLLRAEALRIQREYDRVLATLTDLDEPSSTQALDAELLKGRVLLETNRIADARKAFEQAHGLAPDAVLPLIGLSRTAFADNDLALTREYIKKAEELDGQTPALWLWKAQFAQATQDWATAESAYIRALEDIGQYDVMTFQKYETISALINVLRAQNKSGEAFVYEEILAKSAPGNIKSNLEAAQEAFNKGDMDAAGHYLEGVLRQAPSHEKSALLLGLVRFRQGRVEEAERLLSYVVNQGSDALQASKLLAATKIQMQDPEGARELLENLDEKQSDPEILALTGIAALASGDTHVGETFIERALELNPDNQSLRLRYANYFARQGDHDRAIALAEQVMNANPTANQARLLIIRSHMAAGNTAAAAETANAWIKEQPDNASALLIRGQLAAQTGNLDEARQYFNQAATQSPDSAGPKIALGALARSQGNQEEALKLFRQAVTLEPNNRQALQNLATSQEREESLVFMREVLAKQPDAIGPKLVLLEAALEAGDTPQADQLSADLLERRSESAPAQAAPVVESLYKGVAENFLKAGELDKAAALLNRGRVLFPENEDIALQSALISFHKNDEHAAREIIQEAKQMHPASARPYITEASYRTSQGRHEDAAELFRQALGKQDSVATVLAYSRALQNSDQSDKAISVLEDAATRFPERPEVALPLALLYQSNNQPEKASDVYERIIEAAPNNVVALNNLAWLRHENKDDRALKLAERAYQLSPKSAAVTDTYGWILLASGHVQKSVEILEQALQLQPDAKDIANHLAEAYKANGQEAEARQVLEKL